MPRLSGPASSPAGLRESGPAAARPPGVSTSSSGVAGSSIGVASSVERPLSATGESLGGAAPFVVRPRVKYHCTVCSTAVPRGATHCPYCEAAFAGVICAQCEHVHDARAFHRHACPTCHSGPTSPAAHLERTPGRALRSGGRIGPTGSSAGNASPTHHRVVRHACPSCGEARSGLGFVCPSCGWTSWVRTGSLLLLSFLALFVASPVWAETSSGTSLAFVTGGTLGFVLLGGVTAKRAAWPLRYVVYQGLFWVNVSVVVLALL